MAGIMEWIVAHQTAMLLGELGVLVFVLLIFVINQMKVSKLSKMYKRLLSGNQGDNLEGTLLRILELTESNQRRIRDLDAGLKDMEEKAKGMVQRVGVVRFNAFDNVGSDLSFAIALLDDGGNGVVISSLYGREESRIYAKPINRGRSTYVMTSEENQAVEKAMGDSKY